MFRALAVLRVLVLLNAVALNLYRVDDFDHPRGGGRLRGGDGRRGPPSPSGRTPRRAPAHAAAARSPTSRWRWPLLLLSPFVKGAAMQATLPGFWVMGALLAWAILWRWLGGLVAGRRASRRPTSRSATS